MADKQEHQQLKAAARQKHHRAKEANTASAAPQASGAGVPAEEPTGDPATWNKDELQLWLATYKGSKWREHVQAFKGLSGSEVLLLDKPEVQLRVGGPRRTGTALYDTLHNLHATYLLDNTGAVATPDVGDTGTPVGVHNVSLSALSPAGSLVPAVFVGQFEYPASLAGTAPHVPGPRLQLSDYSMCLGSSRIRVDPSFYFADFTDTHATDAYGEHKGVEATHDHDATSSNSKDDDDDASSKHTGVGTDEDSRLRGTTATRAQPPPCVVHTTPASSSKAIQSVPAQAGLTQLVVSVPHGLDMTTLAGILRRTPDNVLWPTVTGGIAWQARLARSVFGIKSVRIIASKVLNDSLATPAGILRAVLLQLSGFKPQMELGGALVGMALAYIHAEVAHAWLPRQRAHLDDAAATALTVTNKNIRAFAKHDGELSLECLQLGPIVRQPLQTEFDTIQGNVNPAMGTMVAFVPKQDGTTKTKPKRGSRSQARRTREQTASTTAAKKKRFVCGSLSNNVQPDVSVPDDDEGSLLVVLGETKLRPKPAEWEADRNKLGCMSAAASTALQMKIYNDEQESQARGVAVAVPARGKCLCGTPESLFPIPLIQCKENLVCIYYGKTSHDHTAGLCEHRVGCFFRLELHTWSDALLAMAVVQAAAMDVKERCRTMRPHHKVVAREALPGLQTLADAAAAKSSAEASALFPPTADTGGMNSGAHGTVPVAETAALHLEGEGGSMSH